MDVFALGGMIRALIAVLNQNQEYWRGLILMGSRKMDKRRRSSDKKGMRHQTLKLYSSPRLAETIDVSLMTIYRWITAGKIKSQGERVLSMQNPFNEIGDCRRKKCTGQ
jgi:hypothetical protein